MRSTLLLAVALACAAAAPAEANGTNMLTDSGFEQPVIAGDSQTLAAGDTFGPWTATSGEVSIDRPAAWPAKNGAQQLVLRGDGGTGTPGAITQTFATTPGNRYFVKLRVAFNPDCGFDGHLQWVTVGINDRSLVTLGTWVSEWAPKPAAFRFYADSDVTTLSLADANDESFPSGLCGLRLDGVRVTHRAL